MAIRASITAPKTGIAVIDRFLIQLVQVLNSWFQVGTPAINSVPVIGPVAETDDGKVLTYDQAKNELVFTTLPSITPNEVLVVVSMSAPEVYPRTAPDPTPPVWAPVNFDVASINIGHAFSLAGSPAYNASPTGFFTAPSLDAYNIGVSLFIQPGVSVGVGGGSTAFIALRKNGSAIIAEQSFVTPIDSASVTAALQTTVVLNQGDVIEPVYFSGDDEGAIGTLNTTSDFIVTKIGSGAVGTVTEVDTGTGLTGGPIKTTGTISLDVPVTINHGGTGATSLAQHGAVVAGASSLTTVSPGTSGNVLTSDGTDWTSQAPVSGSGTVTEVDTGTGLTGGPITTTGSIALSVPVTVAHGGTGTTSLTAHGILLGEGTGAVTPTAAMTDGQILVGQTSSDPLPRTVSNDATLAASGALTLKSVGTPGTYGDASHVAAITTDSQGRVSGATSTSIQIAESQVTSLVTDLAGKLDNPAQAILDMNSHKITNLTDPASAQDAVTKSYVDNLALGLDFKTAVRLATTTALPTNTYSNGSSGVGATLTGFSFGALSVDGTAVVVGDRILVKNEATDSHNGIYVVTTTGGIAALYVLTRSTDFNQSTDINYGDTVPVSAGATLQGTLWLQTTTGTITVGTSSIVFLQLSGTSTPSGTAGGDLGGTYPDPTVTGLHTFVPVSTPVTISGASTQIVATTYEVDLTIPSGTTTLTATPTIATSGVASDTQILLINTSADSIVFQDDGTLSGSKLNLFGLSTFTLTGVGFAKFLFGGGLWNLIEASARPVPLGGTGKTTLTSHALQVGNGVNPTTQLGLGTTTTVLHGNASGDPAFSAVDLTADVTGTLPYGKGGTGATSLTQHGVVTAGATALGTVAPGTNGNVLTSNGTDWVSQAGGGGPPTGSAGGDLGGSYPNPTVLKQTSLIVKSQALDVTTLGVSTVIPITTPIVYLNPVPGGTTTLTSNPPITVSGAVDGQLLLIINTDTSSSGTVIVPAILTNGVAIPGGPQSFTLVTGGSMLLTFSSALGLWITKEAFAGGQPVPSKVGGMGLDTSFSNGVPSVASGVWSVGSELPGPLSVTGALDMETHQIHHVVDPSSPQDAATKAYVDNAISGLSAAVSVAEAHAATASAAATSADSHAASASAAVSVLSIAVSVAAADLSNKISAVSAAVTSVDAHVNTVSNAVSVLSLAVSVADAHASAASAAATSADAHAATASAAATTADVHAGLASAAVSTLSIAVSVAAAALSSRIDTASALATTADTHANTASAAATSADAHAATASAAVSTLSIAVSVAAAALSARIDTASALATTADTHANTASAAATSADAHAAAASAAISVLSLAVSVADAHASAASAAATSADAHAAAASAAATSVDARVNIVSQQVSVISAGLGLVQMRVVQTDDSMSATGSFANLSGLSLSVTSAAYYEIEGRLLFNLSAPTGTAFGFTYPAAVGPGSITMEAATANITGSPVNLTSANFAYSKMDQTGMSTVATAQLSIVGVSAITYELEVYGLIHTSTTAGTMQLQAKSSATTGAGVVVLAGSYLRAFRIK